MIAYVLIIAVCFGAIIWSEYKHPGEVTQVEEVAEQVLAKEGVNVTIDKTGKVTSISDPAVGVNTSTSTVTDTDATKS